VAGLAVVAGVIALGALVRWAYRDGLPLPLLVYSVVIVVLAFVTSGYFGSKPRYLLPAFPLLLPIAGWLAGRRMAWQAGIAAATLAGGGGVRSRVAARLGTAVAFGRA
jgi:hypothetical protein